MDALVDVFFDLPAVLPIPGVSQVWSAVLVIDCYRGNPWRNATKDFIYEDCYPGMKATSVRNSNDPNFKFAMPSYGVVHP